jgi:hypothetical protein
MRHWQTRWGTPYRGLCSVGLFSPFGAAPWRSTNTDEKFVDLGSPRSLPKGAITCGDYRRPPSIATRGQSDTISRRRWQTPLSRSLSDSLLARRAWLPRFTAMRGRWEGRVAGLPLYTPGNVRMARQWSGRARDTRRGWGKLLQQTQEETPDEMGPQGSQWVVNTVCEWEAEQWDPLVGAALVAGLTRGIR